MGREKQFQWLPKKEIGRIQNVEHSEEIGVNRPVSLTNQQHFKRKREILKILTTGPIN